MELGCPYINQNKSQVLNSQNNAIKAENVIKTEVSSGHNQTKNLNTQSNINLNENSIAPNTQKSDVAFETKNVEIEKNKNTAYITSIASQVQTNITNDVLAH